MSVVLIVEDSEKDMKLARDILRAAAVTASATPTDRSEVSAAGFDAFIEMVRRLVEAR